MGAKISERGTVRATQANCSYRFLPLLAFLQSRGEAIPCGGFR